MSQQHVSIPVPGVACAGHSVERLLSRAAGVVSAYVNGATEMAEVEYDDQHVTLEMIYRTINGCGLHAGSPHVREASSTET
jgi:cation transport ATPase